MKCLLLPLALAALSLAAPSAQAQYPYEAIDLGTLTDSSSAYRINNYGQVALINFQGAQWSGGLWQPTMPNGKVGSQVNVGSLGGNFTTATSINDRGQVTGVSEDASGTRYAYVWDPNSPNATTGTMVNTGTTSDGQFVGINNYGQLAFRSAGHPALWTPSAPNGLTGTATVGFGDSYGDAYAINSSGQFTGNYGLGTYHPYVFTPNTPNTNTGVVVRADQVPGSIALSTGGGNDINDSGTVAGYFWNGTSYNALLWSGTTMVNLTPGALQGNADGINNAGDVVGTVSYVSNQNIAFLYSGGTLSNLNTLIDPSSGWYLDRAFDINDHGQIVGFGYHNGQARGFLLAPASAPEPGTLGLLALGALVGIVGRRRIEGTQRRGLGYGREL